MAKTSTRTSTDEAPDEPATEESKSAPGTETDGQGAGQDEGPELTPGVYEYVHGIGCVYPHVPLTCYAHQPLVPATDTSPEIPEQAATVFDWPDGPPADGRWAKTRKKPNQAADNAGGLLSSKE
ncbi:MULTISPECIES: hypothetical protein [Streptomyces]|uniref:Uncharacterized protein n=1 Tax=Streptomyces doudnae TaxID=3075536 RepID=A0ABD5EP35_9ACTN|nr:MULTISPECIES: hypothetical protein [unclassified Streptomyces]MDT0435605.1 hypothetical protein [Streptomyces sp. DSM 41981]MYQ62560.1 hypothetical protein [Streptomyces sp. SID4950]SCD39960.1 hypothetical protein GA0115242_104864 [Streptomyces sp. SolWspMP-5a-2]